MNFYDIYKTLEHERYYIFSSEDISLFYPKEKKHNLSKLIYRWKKKGWVYPLKNGLYELTYPEVFNIPDMYIANRLYSPSYISLETALSNYSIIPEVSMAVASITTKPTRRFRNRHGLFLYRTLRPQFFTGYYIEKEGRFDILIAEPEKALMDYLYFKTYRSRRLDLTQERLDKDALAKLSRKKMEKYAKLFNLNIKELYAYL